LSDDFEKSWHYGGEKKHGSQFDNSFQVITIMLMMNNEFHLRKSASLLFCQNP
jgi:hypothetical protein